MRTNPLNIACALLLAALLASCSGEAEPGTPGSGTIRFSGAAIPLQTRADEALPGGYAMWVQAIHHVDGAHHVYFPDGAAEFACADGVWGGRDCAYRYPFTGTMDFVAYALNDRGCRPAETFTVSDGSFTGIALDFADMLDGTQDILYSDLISGDNKSADNPLPLRFRHAMAKMQFYLRTEEQTAADHLTITKLTLKSVKRSGVLDIVPDRSHSVTVGDVTTEAGSTASWRQPLSGTTSNLSIGGERKPKLAASPSDPGVMFGPSLCLPPQDSDTFSLEITYSITGSQATTANITDRTTTLTLPGNWQMGREYTYVLTCNLSEIKFHVLTGTIVDQWDSETIYSEEVPQN